MQLINRIPIEEWRPEIYYIRGESDPDEDPFKDPPFSNIFGIYDKNHHLEKYEKIATIRLDNLNCHGFMAFMNPIVLIQNKFYFGHYKGILCYDLALSKILWLQTFSEYKDADEKDFIIEISCIKNGYLLTTKSVYGMFILSCETGKIIICESEILLTYDPIKVICNKYRSKNCVK